VSEWSPTGPCDPNTKSQTIFRTVIYTAKNGGAACPALIESTGCVSPTPTPTDYQSDYPTPTPTLNDYQSDYSIPSPAVNNFTKNALKSTFKTLLQECCIGNLKNCHPNYNGYDAPGCAAQFETCKGSDLIDNDSSYQGQYCMESCKADFKACDVLKKGYCDENPTSSWCKCMNLGKNPDYQAWLQRNGYSDSNDSKFNYTDRNGIQPCKEDNTQSDLNGIFIPYDLKFY
jgi:hypothetical protein